MPAMIHRADGDALYRARHFERDTKPDATLVRVQHGGMLTLPLVGVDRPGRRGEFFKVWHPLACRPIRRNSISPAMLAAISHRAARQILRRPAPIRVSRWAGATNDPAIVAHLYH